MLVLEPPIPQSVERRAHKKSNAVCQGKVPKTADCGWGTPNSVDTLVMAEPLKKEGKMRTTLN